MEPITHNHAAQWKETVARILESTCLKRSELVNDIAKRSINDPSIAKNLIYLSNQGVKYTELVAWNKCESMLNQ